MAVILPRWWCVVLAHQTNCAHIGYVAYQLSLNQRPPPPAAADSVGCYVNIVQLCNVRANEATRHV